ncbi:hypothetical protein BLNAU_14219 [Blattamonas nauphoetae]|uniref:Protein kinase domain-containing protein n=1 Tax=Blattamonas nauphoetae TaxID=2049346 RepID=A0ABQ9XKM0_9EUKA|nr:hypothetical protein BLNAU_14219 [Blattamonas nauphoetae]
MEDNREHGWNGEHPCFAELNNECGVSELSLITCVLTVSSAFSGFLIQTDSSFDLTAFPGFSRFFLEAQKHKLTSYDFIDQKCVRHTFWSSLNPDEEKPEQYVFPTPYTPITFSDCVFTNLKDDTDNYMLAGGGALHLRTKSPLFVTGCTFTNCVTVEGSGGAIFVQNEEYKPDQIRVESSTFKDCSSPSGEGGGICVFPSVRLELISSTFENCSTLFGTGGAVWAENCAASFSTFRDNKANAGGGLACQNGITIQFCHFEGNQATSGNPDFTENHSDDPFPFFGISLSDAHWEAQSDLFFVRSDGTVAAACTFADPCSRLSTAVGLAPPNVFTKVQVGTGSFGLTTLSDTQHVTLTGFFAESDCNPTHPTTSFSIEVKGDSRLIIDTMTLSPLADNHLVNTPSDATNTEIELKHIRLSGSGITAVPFVFKTGTVTFVNACFVSLSDITCSLIAVVGSALVFVSECFFINIEIEASVISVNGGKLTIESTHFRRITRTAGNGAGAVDVRDSQSLTIDASFCDCRSLEGVAGALNIASSAVTQEDVVSRLRVVEDDEIADYTNDFMNVVSARSLESTDFSSLMDQNYFELELSASTQTILTFPPLTLHSGTVQITSGEGGGKTILTQTTKTDESLFTLSTNNGDEVYLYVRSVRFLLNTQLTAPMIAVDAQSSFDLKESFVSSFGSLSKRPFVRSEGSLSINTTLFIDISFDGCSCIETTGGTMTIEGSYDKADSSISSLSTNVDGAFLNANNTAITLSDLAFVDCHAKNGGAIFTKDCLSESFSGYFIDCSAEERGGGFCSEHSGSVSEETSFMSSSHFVNCRAKFGGGFFLTLTPMMTVSISVPQQSQFFGRRVSYSLFEGCSAEKGAGGYLDGEIGQSALSISSSFSINDGSVCKGSEFFISQSLAESIIEIDQPISDSFQSEGSFSSRSEHDDGDYKHVEVEGFPELSYNFELPDIVVDSGPTFDLEGCITEYFTSSYNSLSHLIDRFHTQTDNGRFLQVPIKLRDTLCIFETARVTKQSIQLILNDNVYDPADKTTIIFGDEFNSDITVFIVVDNTGSVELSELKVDWEENLTLCQLVDRTASMSILGCEINIVSLLSIPLIICQAGTLVISASTVFSSITLDSFNQPLVLSEISAPSVSNSVQSDIQVEMNEVKFQNLKMKNEVTVIELNDADHIKLSQVVFEHVELSNESEALRIVVRGRELWKTIEPVTGSGFPQRGNAPIDTLYRSLDRNEEGGPFNTPTLLVYLSAYTAPTIHVQSNGKDVLDEADRHLEGALQYSISVHDSAQLSSQLDLVQDQTTISAKETSTLEVSSSSFSDIEIGGIEVVNGTVRVFETQFSKSKKEGKNSVVNLKSTTLETAKSTSLWINADSSCAVRDSSDVEITNPFFIPSLAASSCSVSLNKKSSEYSVIVVGKDLIPCGLSLIVRENKTSGTPSSVPFGLNRLRFIDETNVSISILKSELSAFDGTLGWIGLFRFGRDGESNPFTFKVDAKQARAELMRQTLPWLIPLIVVVVAAVVVVIILICVCRRRRLSQNEPKSNEMNDDTVQVEEDKMDGNDGTQGGLQTQDVVTMKGNVIEEENNTARAGHVPDSLLTALNVVEALRCQGKVEMTVVQEVDTLFNALHVGEQKRSIVKRVIERQIASGMAKIGEQTSTSAILTKLSSHWVMFDADNNVCLKLQEPTPSISQPQPHTHQPSQPSQSGTGDKSNTQENQRWKAPEVVKAEEEKESKLDVNPLKAAVFSLGLVLWEIETGTVPFAELDAVNAQRQMGTGTLPKMEGLGSEMRALIDQCLSLNPDDRPALSTVSSILDSIAEDEESTAEPKTSNT